ncbi:hypothetical protein [Flagellimonas iocasae]|uniref:Uncharacterized protein n=1 Tax=Flagellimonas iocasae TaxID=2055905 RepID=A0ABW4XZA0_9FLAO
MGLFLLNISVDSVDPNPDYIPEDLSFNDQESIIEIVVEKILGFENAFEEYDDPDSEDHNKKNNVKVNLLVLFYTNYKAPHLLALQNSRHFPDHGACLTSGFGEIDSPPPKI